jgi:pimeloyl-ACP methyl ester carboxylesterase
MKMTQSKPVIIFVPGAFLGAGPYAPVAESLRADDYTVEVVNLPSAADLSSEDVSSPKWKDLAEKTVESDIQAIRDVFNPHFEQGRQVVVIGHSYGSIPAMLSIEGHTVQERETKGLQGGVFAFVNIAGFAFAARGKNAMGTDEDPPPMPYHKFEVCMTLSMLLRWY